MWGSDGVRAMSHRVFREPPTLGVSSVLEESDSWSQGEPKKNVNPPNGRFDWWWSSWWLNQPIWKICSSNPRYEFSQIQGMNFCFTCFSMADVEQSQSRFCRWNLFGTLMSWFLSNIGWGVPGYMLGCSWSLIPENLQCFGMYWDSNIGSKSGSWRDHPHLGWIYQKISKTNLLLGSKFKLHKSNLPKTNLCFPPEKWCFRDYRKRSSSFPQINKKETTGRGVEFSSDKKKETTGKEFEFSSDKKTKVVFFSVGFKLFYIL